MPSGEAYNQAQAANKAATQKALENPGNYAQNTTLPSDQPPPPEPVVTPQNPSGFGYAYGSFQGKETKIPVSGDSFASLGKGIEPLSNQQIEQRNQIIEQQNKNADINNALDKLAFGDYLSSVGAKGKTVDIFASSGAKIGTVKPDAFGKTVITETLASSPGSYVRESRGNYVFDSKQQRDFADYISNAGNKGQKIDIISSDKKYLGTVSGPNAYRSSLDIISKSKTGVEARPSVPSPKAGATLDTDFSQIRANNEGKLETVVDFSANPVHDFLSGVGNYVKSTGVTIAAQTESLPFAYGKQFERIASGFSKPAENPGVFPLTPEASKFQSEYAKPTFVGSLLGGPPTGRSTAYNIGSASAEVGSFIFGFKGMVPVRSSNVVIDVLQTSKVTPALEEGGLASTRATTPIEKVSVYKGLTLGYEEGGKPLIGKTYSGKVSFGNPKPKDYIPPNVTPTGRGIEISTGSTLSNKLFNSKEALGYMQEKGIISAEDVKVSNALQNLNKLSYKAPVKVYGGFGEKPFENIEAGKETTTLQTSVKGLQSTRGSLLSSGERAKAGTIHGSYADRPFYPPKYTEVAGDLDLVIRNQNVRPELASSLAGKLNEAKSNPNRIFSSEGHSVFVEDFSKGFKSKVVDLPSSEGTEGGIPITTGTKVYGKAISTDIYKIEGQTVHSPRYNFSRRIAVTGTLQGEKSEAVIFGLGKGTEGGKYLGPPAFRLKDVGRIYKGGLHLSEIFQAQGKTKESQQALESIGILRSRFGSETLGKAGFDFNKYMSGLGKKELPVFGKISEETPSLSTKNILKSSSPKLGSSTNILGSSKNYNISTSRNPRSSSSKYSVINNKSYSISSKSSSKSSQILPKSNISLGFGKSSKPSKSGKSSFNLFGGSSSLLGPSKSPRSPTGRNSPLPQNYPSSIIIPSNTPTSPPYSPPYSPPKNPPFFPPNGPPKRPHELPVYIFGKKRSRSKSKEGPTGLIELNVHNVFSSNLDIKGSRGKKIAFF